MNRLLPVFIMIMALGPALNQAGPAAAQSQLDQAQLTAALTAKIERGLSGPDLWNTGYDFYRLYPPTPESARRIHLAFKAARGLTARQKDDLRQAAAYWLRIYREGPTRVTAGREVWRPDPYLADHGPYLGNPLKMARPDKPGPYAETHRRPAAEWPPPRKNNPYPGSYYPGLYPP